MSKPIVCLTALLALGIAFGIGQSGENQKVAKAVTTGQVLETLRLVLPDTEGFQNPITLKEFMALLQEKLAAYNATVPFVIDVRAFREETPDAPPIEESQVKLPSLRKLPLATILKLALDQLPVPTAYLVRAGRIDVVPQEAASKIYLLNQRFFADFKNRPLDEALAELTDLTGVSVVLDSRAKEKAKTSVTARFRNDVCLQDAVRILAEMAELKLVHLPTGLFVTTPQHAEVFRKELRKIYGDGVPGPIIAPMPGAAPEASPLQPPAEPPSRRERVAA